MTDTCSSSQNNSGEKLLSISRELKNLTENCHYENRKEILIRDIFITNLIDPKIQKELLKQTVKLRKALELAINMEHGTQKLHMIQAHKKTLIPASVNSIQHPPSNRSSNW